MTILHISNVLPSPAKDRVNDILLITASEFSKIYPNTLNIFVVTIPYSNLLLSLISKRWKKYYQLRKRQRYNWDGAEIEVLALPLVKTRAHFLRRLLYKVGFIGNRIRLERLINKHRVSLIHAHNVGECGVISYLLSQTTKVPFVVTTRNIQNYYSDTYTVNYLRKAGALININHKQLELVQKYVDHKRSYIIPHGIDKKFFLDRTLNLKPAENGLKLISLCSLIPLKNIDKVIRALAATNIQFSYDIYGDGSDKNRLESLVNQLGLVGKISFKGYVPHTDVPRLLSGYDVFVMPSYPETFGRVFLEAMAAGLVIIGAKGTGMDGYVTDGVNGFLINHENHFDLQKVVQKLYCDFELLHNVSHNSKLLAKEFGWEMVINKLHSIYQVALSQGEREILLRNV